MRNIVVQAIMLKILYKKEWYLKIIYYIKEYKNIYHIRYNM